MKNRILIVDDDAAIRDTFAALLAKNDFETRTAENGRVSLDIISTENFDLILLDLQMPVMGGVETLREIRKVDQEVPVYILTAFHDKYARDLRKLQNDGIQFEILSKPIQTDHFIAIVKSAFRENTEGFSECEICFYKIGSKPDLQKAFEDLKNYLGKKPSQTFRFKTVDCLENPDAAIAAGIVATPTIVKTSPLPQTRVVGSIADYRKICMYLGID